MMSSIAIFCGSAPGKDSVFVENARKVGETLAAQGKTLIYGGGRSGLMGVVADSTLAAGGRAIGVMPESLAKYELAHPHLTELYIVENMHARKIKMSELAEGFIALPGGSGTLEEIFEQWTWAQLGIHSKPCAFLNVAGFYDDLLKFLRQTSEKGFTQPRFCEALIVSNCIDNILQRFEQYRAPEMKWEVPELEWVQQELVK